LLSFPLSVPWAPVLSPSDIVNTIFTIFFVVTYHKHRRSHITKNRQISGLGVFYWQKLSTYFNFGSFVFIQAHPPRNNYKPQTVAEARGVRLVQKTLGNLIFHWSQEYNNSVSQYRKGRGGNLLGAKKIPLFFLHTNREASALSHGVPEVSDWFRLQCVSLIGNLEGPVGLSSLTRLSTDTCSTIPIDIGIVIHVSKRILLKPTLSSPLLHPSLRPSPTFSSLPSIHIPSYFCLSCWVLPDPSEPYGGRTFLLVRLVSVWNEILNE
jgi:hypothetical protein